MFWRKDAGRTKEPNLSQYFISMWVVGPVMKVDLGSCQMSTIDVFVKID